MDYHLDPQLSGLPRAYREDSRIGEETRFSIELLQTLASLISPSHRPVYANEALATEVLSSIWEESDSPAFFALDCPGVRRAIKMLNEPVDRRHDASPPPEREPRELQST